MVLLHGHALVMFYCQTTKMLVKCLSRLFFGKFKQKVKHSKWLEFCRPQNAQNYIFGLVNIFNHKTK